MPGTAGPAPPPPPPTTTALHSLPPTCSNTPVQRCLDEMQGRCKGWRGALRRTRCQYLQGGRGGGWGGSRQAAGQ